MALPEITAPAGVPAFLVSNHGVTPRSVYANVETTTGHARKRRLYTTAPRIQSVEWMLTSAQMVLVNDWFESLLLVGDRRFSAFVANQGPGRPLWWEAQWVEPYKAEPIAAGVGPQPGMWHVTGMLLLTGEGSASGPVSTTGRLVFGAGLDATVSALIDGHADVEFGAALTQIHQSGLDFGAALIAIEIDYLLREDGSHLLREDGGRLVLETMP